MKGTQKEITIFGLGCVLAGLSQLLLKLWLRERFFEFSFGVQHFEHRQNSLVVVSLVVRVVQVKLIYVLQVDCPFIQILTRLSHKMEENTTKKLNEHRHKRLDASENKFNVEVWVH